MFRNRYSQYITNDLPRIPVRFAIPTIAFHVRMNTISTNRNFLQETILLLKKTGMTRTQIADTLCLDQKLVDIIVINNKKDSKEDEPLEDTIIEKKKSFNEKENCYYLREDIGKSFYNKIHIVSNPKADFSVAIEPSQENIVECYKSGKLFTDNEYKNPQYLGESFSVWLTLDYSVTQYNLNEFSIVNPFRNGISFSTYFSNMINRLPLDTYSRRDIEEYRDDISNSEIGKQNRRMKINSAADNDAYERLLKKYGEYEFFGGKGNSDNLVAQMIKMQANYDYIDKYFGKKDCSEKARTFYVFANNVLEELFIITYAPYVSALYDKLKADDFFEKINKERSDENKKEVIKRYTDSVETVNDYSSIMDCISPDSITRTLSSRNITSEKAFKPGLKELFVINVICSYFFNDCKFNNIMNNKIDQLSDALGVILAIRQQASHTLLKPDEYVEDVIKVVYKIIDTVMEVSEERIIENASENIESLENYMASYAVVNDMNRSLQDASNRLLIDLYNANELYFSDCVIAFQNTSKVIIDYIMRNVNSLSQLEDYLKLIPDEEDEAKIALMENLDKAGVDSNFDRITVRIRKAKRCLIKNIDLIPASSLIFFAPLLLSVVDSVAFISLFENLGAGYLNDAIDAINARGHNKLSVNWDEIKIINDRYLEYCRILTLFDREEL